jgi:hypothetical protein
MKPTESMPNPDEEVAADPRVEELVSFLDGELDADATDRLEARLQRDPKLRAEAESLKKTWDLLDFLPRPEPSESFTEKTMSRLQAVVPEASIPVAEPVSTQALKPPTSGASPSQAVSTRTLAIKIPRSSVVSWTTFCILFALGSLLGLMVGNIVRSNIREQREREAKLQLVAEAELLKPLLKRLPFYQYLDDLEYLQALEGAEIFGDEGTLARFADPIDPVGDRSELEFLQQQMNRWKALSPARQSQIRELEQKLKTLDEPNRTTLNRVMQAYAVWIDELPNDQRKRITEAANSLDRLVTVKDLREKQWLTSLPKSQRDLFASKKDHLSEQADLVKQWRDEEQRREQEWRIAGPLMEQIGEKVRHVLDQPLAKRQVELWIKTVEGIGFDGVGRELNLLKQEMRSANPVAWTWFGLRLYRIQEANYQRLLPGPLDGPKSWESLPPDVRKALLERDKQAQKNLKQLAPRSQSRWPDYALAVRQLADQLKITLPASLGPNKLESMPADLRIFIKDQLIPEIAKLPDGKRMMAELQRAEKGTWPDFPRTLVKVANEAKIVIPGWMLPGTHEEWHAIFEPLKKRRR